MPTESKSIFINRLEFISRQSDKFATLSHLNNALGSKSASGIWTGHIIKREEIVKVVYDVQNGESS